VLVAPLKYIRLFFLRHPLAKILFIKALRRHLITALWPLPLGCISEADTLMLHSMFFFEVFCVQAAGWALPGRGRVPQLWLKFKCGRIALPQHAIFALRLLEFIIEALQFHKGRQAKISWQLTTYVSDSTPQLKHQIKPKPNAKPVSLLRELAMPLRPWSAKLP
jgi:hypothetical protein